MKRLLVAIIGILLTVSAVPGASADSITLTTNTHSYTGVQRVVMNGAIAVSSAVNASTGVIITTTNPQGAQVDVGEAPVSPIVGRLESAFSYVLVTGGNSLWVSGTYSINATWGDPNGKALIALATFTYNVNTTSSTSSSSSSSTSSSTKSSTSSSTSSTTTSSNTTSSTSVNPHIVVGKFDAVASGGTIVNATFNPANDDYEVKATSPSNATLNVVVPTGVYPQGYFWVSGAPPGSLTYDAQSGTLSISFQTSLDMTIEPPPEGGNTMSTFDIASVSSGPTLLDQFRISPITLNGVTAYAVYYQTPSTSLACTSQLQQGSASNCVAYPFQPVTDPTGTYTVTFGFAVNGQVFFVIQGTKQLNVVVTAYQLQNGQVVQLDPSKLPSTPYYVDVPMPVATAFDVHLGSSCTTSLLAAGCEDLGALSWTMNAGGVISLQFMGLNNQPIASGAVTVTDLPILAVQGTTGAISVESLTMGTGTNTFRIYGTDEPAVSQLAGNQYGPIALNLQPTLNIVTSTQPNIPPTTTAAAFGSWDWVTLTFTEPPGVANFAFNYTVNGYQLGSILFATESGANPAFTQPPSCTGGVCVIEFKPNRAGVFQIVATSQTFAGTYRGGYTFVAQPSPYDSGIPGGIFLMVIVVGFVVMGRRRMNRTQNPDDYNGGTTWK